MPALPQPRVLVTRAPNGGSELAEHLRAAGCDPVLIPAIELAPPTSFAVLDAAVAALASFDWLLFTSANAVEAFARKYNDYNDRVPQPRTGSPLPVGYPPRSPEDNFHPERIKMAAIGPATARALEAIGLAPDLIPPRAVAESLTAALLPYARRSDGRATRFLLIRAEEAREHLPQTLRDAGAEVVVAPAYRTVIPESSVALLRELFAPGSAPPAAITFTSASTARNLQALCEAAGVRLPASALRISIGPVTSQALSDLGLPAHRESAEATVDALARTTTAALSSHSPF